jgi:4-amino-4-deoxy-L-arabinose transferase-like glycosyltransferase
MPVRCYDRPMRNTLVITAMLLLAALMQVSALSQAGRLHPDEALYATFARDAAVKGAWWLPGALDKTPLALYAQAASMALFGTATLPDGVLTMDPEQGEWAARMPAFFASILTVALVARAAFQLTRRQTVAWIAALLAALSPMRIAFGATAFLDAPLALCTAAALVLALERRWFWAGAVVALAVAIKPQGLLLIALPPLLMLAAPRWRPADAGRFVGGVLAGLLPLLVWDLARSGTSVFALGAVNNAHDSLFIAADALGARLTGWWAAIQDVAGHPALTGFLFLLAIGGASLSRRGGAIGVWVALVAGLHVLTTVNIYDRYILLLLPAVWVLAAAAGWRILCDMGPRPRRALAFAASAALLFIAIQTTGGVSPSGGPKGAHASILTFSRHLNELPVATVIYDRWLGWELGYAMGPWHNKRFVHYPDSASLVAGALALDEPQPRYFIAPRSAPVGADIDALWAAGFRPRLVFRNTDFRMWEITPP